MLISVQPIIHKILTLVNHRKPVRENSKNQRLHREYCTRLIMWTNMKHPTLLIKYSIQSTASPSPHVVPNCQRCHNSQSTFLRFGEKFRVTRVYCIIRCGNSFKETTFARKDSFQRKILIIVPRFFKNYIWHGMLKILCIHKIFDDFLQSNVFLFPVSTAQCIGDWLENRRGAQNCFKFFLLYKLMFGAPLVMAQGASVHQ